MSPEQQMLAQAQGALHVHRVAITALLASMPEEHQPAFAAKFEELAEAARSNVLAMPVPEELVQGFDEELLAIRRLSLP